MADAACYDIGEIERELATAVETERQRLATDEMKKRAILTAPSYDAFRNLVACANQKPVNQKDMEVLAGSAVKKFPPIRNASASKVGETTAKSSGLGRRRRRAPGATPAQPSTAPVVPTSARSFSNAWAVCPDDSARGALLGAVSADDWASWHGTKAPEDSMVGGMVAFLAEAELPLACSWLPAVLGALPPAHSRVWAGTLPPAQVTALETVLRAVWGAAEGADGKHCIASLGASVGVPLE